MKFKLVSLLSMFATLLTPGVLRAQSPARQYAHRIVSPGALATSGAAAGLDQALDNPYEWGGGITGLGRRFASAFGTHVLRSSVHFVVGKLLHEELDYQPSGRQGFGSRLEYALVSTVVTHKTTTEKKTPAVGEISGILAGGFISRLWHPAIYHTAASGFSSCGVGFAGDAGMNVLHEFWPDIRRRLHKSPRLTNPQAP